MKLRGVINLSDPAVNRMTREAIRDADGPHRFDVCRYRPRRGDRQNSFYWAGFCEPFADWLSERYGRNVTSEHAHRIFADTFLRVPEIADYGEVVCGPDGNPLMRTRSTTELTVDEFSEYLDRCGQLLVDLCDLPRPDAAAYREGVGR